MSNSRDIWALSSVDKVKFYANAIYLSEVQPTQPPDSNGSGRTIRTPPATRDFLDRMADCFARSKDRDSPAHVTATAMVRDDTRKHIKIYIAKNKGRTEVKASSSSGQAGRVEDENQKLAGALASWLNSLASGASSVDTPIGPSPDWRWNPRGPMWMQLVEFNVSRLSFYASKISALLGEGVLSAVRPVLALICFNIPSFYKALDNVRRAIDKYSRAMKTWGQWVALCSTLSACAIQAWRCRRGDGMHAVRSAISAVKAREGGPQVRGLAEVGKLIKWIDYLGRLPSAYANFVQYCRNEVRGYTFDLLLLQTRDEYIPTKSIMNIQGRLPRPSAASRRISCYFHCEMQLLRLFAQETDETCEDYFGCSKKSCWLCWQILSRFPQYNTKESHYRLYPHWAFSFHAQHRGSNDLAAALRETWEHMASRINTKAAGNSPWTPYMGVAQTSARLSILRQKVDLDPIQTVSTIWNAPLSSYRSRPMPGAVVPRLSDVRVICLPQDGPVDAYELKVGVYYTGFQYDKSVEMETILRSARVKYGFQNNGWDESRHVLETSTDSLGQPQFVLETRESDDWNPSHNWFHTVIRNTSSGKLFCLWGNMQTHGSETSSKPNPWFYSGMQDPDAASDMDILRGTFYITALRRDDHSPEDLLVDPEVLVDLEMVVDPEGPTLQDADSLRAELRGFTFKQLFSLDEEIRCRVGDEWGISPAFAQALREYCNDGDT